MKMDREAALAVKIRKPRTASCRIGGVEMDLPLERGVKIPPIDYTDKVTLRIVLAKSRLRNIWPWKRMRNHESLLIPWGFASSVEMIRSACALSQYHPGMKFIFRSFNEGMRVWRKDSVSHPKKPIDRPKGTR